MSYVIGDEALCAIFPSYINISEDSKTSYAIALDVHYLQCLLVLRSSWKKEQRGECFRLLLNYLSTTGSSDRGRRAALQFILPKKPQKSIMFKEHTKDAVKLGGDSEQGHR